IWRIKLCEILAMACAPIGAAFTAITLATGSIWGKPMWGTWWDWDPRLTSQLVLLFLYFGVIRSEEHTSELQSRENLVCRLLLEVAHHHRHLHSFPTRRSSDLHLADQAVRDPGHGLRADRRRLHRHHPGHRQHLGQADVGYLVGLGPAPDLAAGAAVPLLRRDRAVRGDRGPPRRRARGFAAGNRRRGDAADHPLLGGVVELAPPGTDHPRVRRVVDGPEHDAAAAVDGGRHEVLGDRLAAGPRPRRQPRPRGRQGLGQAPGRRGCGMTYLAYVVAAYAVFAA